MGKLLVIVATPPVVAVVLVVGLVREVVKAVREGPSWFVKEYPDGPIYGSWHALREPRGARWVQRWDVYRWVFRRFPEKAYPVFAVVVVSFVGGIWVLIVQDVVTGWPLGFAVILASLVVIYGAIGSGGLYRLAIEQTRASLAHDVKRWPRIDRAFGFALAVYVPTLAFAAVTTLLVRYDLLDVEGASASDRDLTTQAFATYLWYLADAVPVLKIPETLHWTPALRFPTWQGGCLALLYKVLLLLPAAQLLAYGLSRLWGSRREEGR